MKRNLFCILGLLLLLALVSCKNEEDFSIPIDGDGNVYRTLQIGERTWMVGPLYTTTFNDGSPIVLDETWSSVGSRPVYCGYDNDLSHGSKYGHLYNWPAVASGRLAPKGWHVATADDWTDLARNFGGWDNAGIALKALTGWAFYTDSVTATNESGLGLLPTGCRENYTDSAAHHGEFHGMGFEGFWWTSTPVGVGDGGMLMSLSYRNNELWGHGSAPDFGAAVICVKN